jgi:lipooligosaccharide transport system ATP-binding protein
MIHRHVRGQGMAAVIEATGLTKRFGDLVAVDHVSFRVEPGEVFGFLGPNGAGKTTTMRMIQCVSPKTEGSLQVFGKEVDGHESEIKRQIGVVPQENNLDPDFTVYQNLLVYARYFDITPREADPMIQELLTFVELSEKRDTPIEKLSGGMKRRLILARALINRPRLLILDEPTVGLDPQARHLIWERLRELRNRGNTIVLTTHYLEEAERLCDRLVIMDRGGILVEGQPRDLVKTHAGTHVVEADDTPEVRQCLDRMGTRYEPMGGMVQAYTDAPRDVTRTLVGECQLGHVAARPATLEDVFLRLTGRKLRE